MSLLALFAGGCKASSGSPDMGGCLDVFGPPLQHYSVGEWSVAIAIGDLNGDGMADLAVNGIVLLNQGSGIFSTSVHCESDGYVVIGDLNGDGKPDIVGVAGVVSVLLNRGDATFTPKKNCAAGAGPVSVAIADLNGDGRADLVVANQYSNAVSILFNACSSAPRDRGDVLPRDAACADSKPDLPAKADKAPPLDIPQPKLDGAKPTPDVKPDVAKLKLDL